MSKSDKYAGKPRHSDAQRMIEPDEARTQRFSRKKKTKGRHNWYSGGFARFMHQMETQRSGGQACFLKPVYVPEYDAMYCPKHMVWIEQKCKDQNCKYCASRPSSPKKLKVA